MASVDRYGREISTVFDLLGLHEPALTAALGWTLAQSPKLMRATLARLDLDTNLVEDDLAVHLEKPDDLGRTDIELFTATAHVLMEAKQGWIVPGDVQLAAYVPRLTSTAGTDGSGLTPRLVTLSDSTAAWAREVLPADVGGIPVTHWSWDDVRDLVTTARGAARGPERLWLDQLEEYMGAATSRRAVTDSLAYCVVISNDLFGGVSFRDYVENQRVYFHPVTGGGWPTVPPNFLAFRWGNAVRQVNRVLDYEIVADLTQRLPMADFNQSHDPHVVYRLGPDIPLPEAGIPSGPEGLNLRAQRFWVLLDQLLTHPTVIDAREATKALGAT